MSNPFPVTMDLEKAKSILHHLNLDDRHPGNGPSKVFWCDEIAGYVIAAEDLAPILKMSWCHRDKAVEIRKRLFRMHSELNGLEWTANHELHPATHLSEDRGACFRPPEDT